MRKWILPLASTLVLMGCGTFGHNEDATTSGTSSGAVTSGSSTTESTSTSGSSMQEEQHRTQRDGRWPEGGYPPAEATEPLPGSTSGSGVTSGTSGGVTSGSDSSGSTADIPPHEAQHRSQRDGTWPAQSGWPPAQSTGDTPDSATGSGSSSDGASSGSSEDAQKMLERTQRDGTWPEGGWPPNQGMPYERSPEHRNQGSQR